MPDQIHVVLGSEGQRWDSILHRIGRFDSYFTSSYHQMEAERTGAQAEMLFYESGGELLALPLLVRKIPQTASTPGLLDVTSVYGYAGWICRGQISEEGIQEFLRHLRAYLIQRRVVSLFCRMHPLFEQSLPSESYGVLETRGSTLVLSEISDITRYENQVSRGHSYEIRKLRESGCEVLIGCGSGILDEFHDSYIKTMQRVSASPQYMFDRGYFDRLSNCSGFEVLVYSARCKGRTAAMAMFLRCGEIINYHLSCSVPSVTRFPATKLILDQAIRDAARNGIRDFHLGGGVGAKEDSLYHFKKGFGARPVDFRTWKWVIRACDYEELTLNTPASEGVDNRFFPAYRR